MKQPYSRLLSIIVITGILGTVLDLLLLGHTEDFWQNSPLLVLGLALTAFVGMQFSSNVIWIKLTRGSMVLILGIGIIGLWMHYESNVEFEKEMYPNLTGFKLFTESMKGAIPSLAPGAMIMLALTGLLKTLENRYNN